MTGWHEQTLVAFDIESTGIDVETARIVTAAVVTIDPAAGTVTPREWLVDPGIDIPAEATEIHGITTELARTHGRPPGEAVAEIVEMLSAAWDDGLPVIAFNASYDVSLLDRELRRHYDGTPLAPGLVIDPFVIDKHYDRYRRGSRKLVNAARAYGIVLSDEDAHGAYADALTAARLAWKLAKVHPELAAMRLPELHAHQIDWHAEQAAGLAEHFARQGRTEHVPTEWPLRPVPAVAA